MKVFLGSLTASLYAASALATRQPPVSVNIIPGPVAAGPSTAQFTSLASGFDAPKLSSVNNTVFDWWYFDAVSSNLKGSAVLIPFTSGATGLWTGMPDMGATTWFAAVFTLANGTGVEFFLPATSLTVVTTDDGSSGAFGGLNVDWFGAPDMSTYVLTVDEPEAGIQGSLTLRSAAPAHFPCSAAADVAGKSYALSPEFGWANAVPDADAIVDFTLNGERLSFTGVGYHDKNWGNKPVSKTVKSWYWGHTRVGPYSVVWFDDIAPNGKEYVSNYVSENGKIVAASCSGLTVRPTGKHATYPPSPTSGVPDGFLIDIEIPLQGKLVLEVTNTLVLSAQPGTNSRWIGSVTAGFGGKKTWTGVALYEAFTF